MTAEQTRVDAADRFKLIISARLTCVVRTFWHLAISRLWLKAFASKCCGVAHVYGLLQCVTQERQPICSELVPFNFLVLMRRGIRVSLIDYGRSNPRSHLARTTGTYVQIQTWVMIRRGVGAETWVMIRRGVGADVAQL